MWDFPGSPVVRLCPSNARGTGSIPGWGTKIPHPVQPKKKKKNYNCVGEKKKVKEERNDFLPGLSVFS